MATIYKRGKRWYLNYTVEGKRRQKSLGACSEIEARVALSAAEIEIRTGENPLTPQTEYRLTDILPEVHEWYQLRHPASYERTLIFQGHLLPYFGNVHLTEINTPLITKYQTSRMEAVSIPTINKEVGHLQKLLNLAVEWELIAKNPLASKNWKLENPESKPPRYFEKRELQRLYEFHPESAPLWQILAGTGMRRKEAMNLKWVDIKDGELHILSTSQRRNKTGKWRQIPMSPNVKKALSQLPRDSEFVFPQMDHRNFSRKFERHLQRLNIKNASLHTLRHTFCSHLASNGVPLRTIQILAGHSSFSTTERYAHLAPKHLHDAVQGLDL
jgi:integrase